MILKRFLLGLVACLMLAGCSSSDGQDEGYDDGQAGDTLSSRIYVLASKHGSLAPAAAEGAAGSWVLTLHDLEPEALWYADRPGREAGTTSLEEYVGALWRDGYGDVPPNATIHFRADGQDELDGVYASLSEPAHDPSTGTLTFRAEILAHSRNRFEQDALSLTGATVHVLNNAVDDQEVASYVQYAGQAVLHSAAVLGQYRVVLEQAGPNTLWVDNAPGQYAASRPMSSFFSQWPHIFREAPPNAALFGTTAAGELKLHFVTLTDPRYDEAAGRVSYTATLLNHGFGALETLHDVILNIDSGAFDRFPVPGKGTAYEAFGTGYNPSTSGESNLYFGSDAARSQMGSLWGTRSYLSQSCEPHCRNDLQTIKDMGANLIRLYDWDPRNDHSQFLDHAHSLGIGVVVPISNWLPGNPQFWDAQVPDYLRHGNFGNRTGTDWHPAIAGVIISNELDILGDAAYQGAIGLTARFIEEADRRGYGKSVRVGVPVTFSLAGGPPYGPSGQVMPGWRRYQELLADARLVPHKDRLMLAANTYNSGDYLFRNAEATGEGWVPLTYRQFGVPILFTEIGLSRADPNYSDAFIRAQLRGALEYQVAHPDQLLGAVHFQYANKVWLQTPQDTVSEGAFGTFRHGEVLKSIQTVQSDYSFYPGEPAHDFGVLSINRLEPTSTHTTVTEVYRSFE